MAASFLSRSVTDGLIGRSIVWTCVRFYWSRRFCFPLRFCFRLFDGSAALQFGALRDYSAPSRVIGGRRLDWRQTRRMIPTLSGTVFFLMAKPFAHFAVFFSSQRNVLYRTLVFFCVLNTRNCFCFAGKWIWCRINKIQVKVTRYIKHRFYAFEFRRC